jgi:hypothetical protein
VLFYGGIASFLAALAVVLAIPLLVTYFETGLVPRFPTAILVTGLIILAAMSFACGLILDTVVRGRREFAGSSIWRRRRRARGVRSPAEARPMEGRKSRTAIEAAARHPLAWILLLAALVRLCTLPLHGFHHPDEIFQYLEQAHRLAVGYGVVPWEYRAGIRHWLLPILLSGPMWLGEKLGGEPSFTIPFVRGFVALVSLAVPLSFYVIGRRISPLHGMLAGLVGAVWYELVHFSTHPLSEPFALALIMPAFAIAGSPGAKPRILALAGLLFGLAILVRFQMAPAIATLILVGCWSRWRETFLPLALGGAVALLIGAAVDLATGIVPYSWVWKNFAINIGEGRAATYGVSGPFFYLGTIASVWSVAILLLFPLAWAGARRQPALFAAAVVHLLLHSLIGHKEYRFVLFTTSALVLLAAFGVGRSRALDRPHPPQDRHQASRCRRRGDLGGGFGRARGRQRLPASVDGEPPGAPERDGGGAGCRLVRAGDLRLPSLAHGRLFLPRPPSSHLPLRKGCRSRAPQCRAGLQHDHDADPQRSGSARAVRQAFLHRRGPGFGHVPLQEKRGVQRRDQRPGDQPHDRRQHARFAFGSPIALLNGSFLKPM